MTLATVDAMHNHALLALALDSLPPHVTALALPPLDVGASCEHQGGGGCKLNSFEPWLERYLVSNC